MLVVCLFYWKLTLSRRYSWLDSPDFAYQVLPWYQFQAAEWHAGRFPVWSPYEWAGQSLIGQGQPGAAYPLNWILFLLPLRDGWIRQIYLHWYFVLIHCMAVVFAWWLCRDLGCSRWASALGGLAFGLGGWVGSTDWPQMLNGAVWMPVVMLFLLRVLEDRAPVRNAALSGAALGLAFLSGHHQAPTFIALAAGGVWIYLFAARPRDRRLAAGLAAFAIMAALVSALQALSAVEYGRLAVRWVNSAHDPVGWKDPVPYAVHAAFGLQPRTLPGIVIPTIYRHASPYIGVVVFMLASIAVAARTADRRIRVLAAIGLGGLIFSLSQFAVFHGILYALVPLVEKARNPSMAILVFHFAAAVLAAFGADAVLARDPAALVWSRRAQPALIGFAVALGIAMLWITRSGSMVIRTHDRVILAPAIAALLAALLWAARRGAVPRSIVAAALIAMALFEFDAGSSSRSWHKRANQSLLAQLGRDGDIAGYLASLPGPPRIEVDSDSIPYNFGDWYGMDAYDAYNASLPVSTFHVQGNTTARLLLGAAFYIGRQPRHPDQIPIFTSGAGIGIYVNPNAAPRVWTAHDLLRIPEREVPAQWLREIPDLLSRPFMTAGAPTLDRCGGNDRVRLAAREPNRVVIEAEMACRGLVIVSEPFFPGWVALVDGRPAPIHEVYGAIRGVVTGAGTHRIEMHYRPRTVVIGACLTFLGLALAGLLAFTARLAPAHSGHSAHPIQ